MGSEIPRVSLVVTDLDNTLYDWMSSFVPAFYAMVEVAGTKLDIPFEQLLDDLKAVHQKHGNSEHPFALLEAKAVQERIGHLSRDDQVAMVDEAFHEFNRVRKSALKLYDGVNETLEYLKSLDIPVVAHTDARIQNSLFRLQKLNIIRLIDRLYAPQHIYTQSDPKEDSVTATEFVRLLPPEDRKPNPKALADICGDFKVEPSEALYVGDSVVRDIFMAQRAGVRSAWAKYGTKFSSTLWLKLVRVTHWTNADVERDSLLRDEAKNIKADVELENFADILKFFKFEKPLRSHHTILSRLA